MSGVGRWVPVVLGAILVWPAIPLLELAVGSAILARPALLMTPMRSLVAVLREILMLLVCLGGETIKVIIIIAQNCIRAERHNMLILLRPK